MLTRLVCLITLASGTAIYATTIGAEGTTCPDASLAVYQGLGVTGCTVNGLLYNNFTFLLGYSNGGTPTPTASDIRLSPSSTGTGLVIAYPVVTRNYVSFAFQYDWDPVPATGDTGLELDVTGDVDVFQSLCPGGPFQNVPNGCFGEPTNKAPVNLEVYNDHQGRTKLTDTAVINPPVTNGEVQLYFALNGLPNAPAGFDRLGSTLSPPVPEPKTFGLIFVALIVMAGVRFTAIRGQGGL